MMSEGKLWIDGQWMAAEANGFQSTCPVDQSVVWRGGEASAAQVELAFSAARKAFGNWFQLGAERRIEFCRRFAEGVAARGESLAELISRETGKPLWESRTEVAAVVGKINLSVEAFRTRRDTTSFEMGEARAVTRYKPHGVCAVLGPFNFPAHLPNGHLVPALIAGNTIVFKPSEITPAVGEWLCRQWSEAGLPAGVLNLLQGGRGVGERIAGHPELDGLFFTGSSAAGKALHQAFASSPQKILALEMGGNNPLVVHQVGDLEGASYATILSAYFTAGQRCTCARRLIVVEDQRSDLFLQTLLRMIQQVRVGFYSDQPQPFMGTVISANAGRRLLQAQEQLIREGGVSLLPMQPLRGCDALLSPGLIDVTEIQHRSDEELFGPLLTLIRVPSFEQAIEEANRTAYGLSAGLLCDQEDLYQQFIVSIRAGIVNWNRQTTGASGKLPFGGCGMSGNHRPSAFFAADYCSYPVASLESSSLRLPEKLEPGIVWKTEDGTQN
jgi:succinylglutamic semialdehyde dehydrogenase